MKKIFLMMSFLSISSFASSCAGMKSQAELNSEKTNQEKEIDAKDNKMQQMKIESEKMNQMNRQNFIIQRPIK